MRHYITVIMRKYICLPLALLSAVMMVSGCDDSSGKSSHGTVPPEAAWARSVVSSTNTTYFTSLATDRYGNAYAAGFMYGNSDISFGSDATTAWNSNTYEGLVLVKYDVSGSALWAKTIELGPTYGSRIHSVAVDSSGNIYAAGYYGGDANISFGNGKTVQGVGTMDQHYFIVKYDSTATAQWAKTDGNGFSHLNAVVADSSGNIYAAGYVSGSGGMDGYFFDPIHATVTHPNNHAVLVKYDTDGVAQFVKYDSGDDETNFNSLAVDSAGNVYAAGYIRGTGKYVFGIGNFFIEISATGSSAGKNAVLVKYDSDGNAKWAKTVSTGSTGSLYNSVTVDASDNVYVAGIITGLDLYTFNTGVTAGGTYTGNNPVIVKYDSDGRALWAKTVCRGASDSCFNSVAARGDGTVYAVGSMYGSQEYSFSSLIGAAGTANSGLNALIVQYDGSGNVLSAGSTSTGSMGSEFKAIVADSEGGLYTAGYLYGAVPYFFGDDITVSGFYNAGDNSVLVRYQ